MHTLSCHITLNEIGLVLWEPPKIINMQSAAVELTWNTDAWVEKLVESAFKFLPETPEVFEIVFSKRLPNWDGTRLLYQLNTGSLSPAARMRYYFLIFRVVQEIMRHANLPHVNILDINKQRAQKLDQYTVLRQYGDLYKDHPPVVQTAIFLGLIRKWHEREIIRESGQSDTWKRRWRQRRALAAGRDRIDGRYKPIKKKPANPQV